MSKSIFLKNPEISFPNQNPRPQAIEPTPLILTIECPPRGKKSVKHAKEFDDTHLAPKFASELDVSSKPP